ncbi:hypothetical protein CKAN_00170600 [Cinnamomum micranthum f. kanehirae]|uniref:Reverse transcriptase Ty1/copia-type domain-containing protein n=1 Tax=Cinnamomum micranthum f. kanehirae TaxID=337451 RepID=A0A3S3PTW3_9MAGN|nr:hypothetical protein CKAN_00170600 [Cinnamomum micranthum f. kanehirae]
MAQPQGYTDPNKPSHVCLMQKSIYGLHQASRAWYENFTSKLLGFGFLLSVSDPSLFIKCDNGCKPVSSPTSKEKLSPSDGPLLDDPTQSRRIVGALQYASLTRPDISYVVNQGTLTYGLHFCPGPLRLYAYCDADWAGSPFVRRSTSGYCVFLGPNPISWSAKKQNTVACSSTEAEYRCLTHIAAEITWLCFLLRDLHIPLSEIPLIWCDNVSAISLAFNHVFHARTKHVELDYHFVHEKVACKQLDVRFVSSIDQIADIFTKGLSSRRVQHLQSKLCIYDCPLSLRGDDNNTSPMSPGLVLTQAHTRTTRTQSPLTNQVSRAVS